MAKNTLPVIQAHAALETLLHLLQNLPPSVSVVSSEWSHYASLLSYEQDLDDLELYGTERGVLNHDLEILFGSRAKGVIQLKERGAGLEAVVPVLKKYIDGKSKEQALLINWIEDLTAAANAVCAAENHEVPSMKRKKKSTKKKAAVEEEKQADRVAKKAKVDKVTRISEAKLVTEQAVSEIPWHIVICFHWLMRLPGVLALGGLGG